MYVHLLQSLGSVCVNVVYVAAAGWLGVLVTSIRCAVIFESRNQHAEMKERRRRSSQPAKA